MEPSRHTYELHSGEWQEVGAQRPMRRVSLLADLGAFLGTAWTIACIAAIGAFVTGIALVLAPVALLGVWILKAIPVKPQ